MNTTLKEFSLQREAVIDFIKEGIIDQGGTLSEAISATSCVYFWDSDDVENLYKCINSELSEHVIAAIVAHDFNGLSGGYKDPYFMPKSSQFSDMQLVDSSERT